jgi:hypothetical protein
VSPEPVSFGPTGIPVTASLGVATTLLGDESFESLIARGRGA